MSHKLREGSFTRRGWSMVAKASEKSIRKVKSMVSHARKTGHIAHVFNCPDYLALMNPFIS